MCVDSLLKQGQGRQTSTWTKTCTSWAQRIWLTVAPAISKAESSSIDRFNCISFGHHLITKVIFQVTMYKIHWSSLLVGHPVGHPLAQLSVAGGGWQPQSWCQSCDRSWTALDGCPWVCCEVMIEDDNYWLWLIMLHNDHMVMAYNVRLLQPTTMANNWLCNGYNGW